jgi:hypothetical protein
MLAGSPARAGSRPEPVALNIGDPPVAEAHEVLDREHSPALVVARDYVHREPCGLRIDDDGRDRRRKQPAPALVGDLARRDDHAVHPSVDHQVEIVGRAPLVVGGAAEKDRVAMCASGIIGRPDQLREERVLDVRDDEAECARATHSE